jgi:hypothetical protein
MESADDVRASLAVAALADLRPHEETSPEGEAQVRALLAGARVLSWPLVVDAESGLILDGSHRAAVLALDLGARYALVQRVQLDAPDVRVEAWCRVLEGVPAAAFDRARRAVGLVAGAAVGLRCHYGGQVYSQSGTDASEPHRLADVLEQLLTSNGHRPRSRLVELVEEETAIAGWMAAGDVVVLRPPAVDKITVRQRAAGPLLPPKTTRFLLPYRVLGLDVPLAALSGAREDLVALLERERSGPLLCLGSGLAIDRRYPERLWQFAKHRIPDGLFADEAGRRAYTDALARASRPTPSPRGPR